MTVDESKALEFLTSYFRMFEAIVESIDVKNGIVAGTVGWPGEEDKQDFSWHIEEGGLPSISVNQLCEYLVQNKLLNGDAILPSESDLIARLMEAGWTADESMYAIDYLMNIHVRMVDDGKETDWFYVHFNA